jgi:hypothetical protein
MKMDVLFVTAENVMNIDLCDLDAILVCVPPAEKDITMIGQRC